MPLPSGCSLFLWNAERVLAGLEAPDGVSAVAGEGEEEGAARALVLARCAADGSFAALQCAEGDERCACVGAEDGALQGEAVWRGAARRAALLPPGRRRGLGVRGAAPTGPGQFTTQRCCLLSLTGEVAQGITDVSAVPLTVRVLEVPYRRSQDGRH